MTYNIEIYTKRNCPYCVRAKELLTRKCLVFKEIPVDDDLLESAVLFKEMCDRSKGHTTVPQIFINNQCIGGSDNLINLNNCGELDSLLCK